MAASVAVLVLSVSPASAAGQASDLHVMYGGYTDVIGSTCPFTNEPPLADVECELWALQLVHERVGSNAGEIAWMAFLFRARYTLHPDGTNDPLFQAFGVVEATNSYFDEARLTKAGIKATIPLDDGSEEDVDVARDGTCARPFSFRETPVHSMSAVLVTWSLAASPRTTTRNCSIGAACALAKPSTGLTLGTCRISSR